MSDARMGRAAPPQEGGLVSLWLKRLAVLAALTGAALFNVALPSVDGYAHLIWLPAGIAVGAVLLWGPRIWPAIFLHSLITDLMLLPPPAGVTAAAAVHALLLAALKSAAPVLAVGVMYRLTSGRLPFSRLFDYLIFALAAGLGAAALVSAGGTAGMALWGRIEPDAAGATLLGWFLGDLTAILFLAPLLPLWWESGRAALPLLPVLEYGLLLAVFVFGLAAFLGLVPGLEAAAGRPLSIIPIALWGALRLPLPLNGLLVLITLIAYDAALAFQAPEAGVLGFSLPVYDDPRLNNMLGLQITFCFTFLGSYMISVLLNEREGANAALRKANLDLEARVESRTRELRKSEARLRGIASASGDAIILVNHEGRVIFWNDAATKLFGYTAAEMTGRAVHDIIAPPHMRRPAQEGFARFQATGKGPGVGGLKELPALHKDGYEIPVELTIAALREQNGYTAAAIIRDIRERKEAERLLLAEKARADSLLRNILPQKVIDRINAGENTIADRVGDVSVMFCDLTGFTPLAASRPASEIVNLLNELFSDFDRLVRESGAEKIKTMGDGYMVAANLHEDMPDHAARLVHLALAMKEVAENLGERRGYDLGLRAGIHSGEVVAGVIGRDKFVFDVWGDTVNVASRMEVHAEAGEVQISDATAERLNGAFLLSGPRLVDVKGRGPMRTWLVYGPQST
ncbi:MAG: adenylate/guanylate cyclase domain-containing protein [Alphaproteobacteria bacterium]